MSIETGIAALALKKLSDRRKRVALMAVAMCVVFATTYALILPALTIDQETAEEQPGIEVAQQEQKDADGAKDAAASDASDEKAADQEQAADQQAQEPAASTDAGSEGEKAAAAADSPQEGSDQQASAPAAKDSEDTPIAAVGSMKAEKGHFAAEVQYDEDAKLPQGTTLKVTPFEETSKEYKEAYKAVVKQKKAEDPSFDEDVFQLVALDISLVDADGKEVEPQSQVQVKLKAKDLIGNESVEDVQIRHLNEQTDKVELVAGSKKGKLKVDESVSAEFEVDSFSTFVISYEGNAALTFDARDSNNQSIGSNLNAKREAPKKWKAVSSYAPEIDGYTFVDAHLESYNGATVTYIKYSTKSGSSGGWRYSSATSEPDDDDNGNSVNSATIVLVYSKNKPVITFNTNGGSESVSSISADANETVTLPNYTGARTDYKFLGWSLRQSDRYSQGETYYSPGASFTMPEENVTLYAVWQSNVTLSFDVNGGTGAVSAIQGEAGAIITLPTAKPTRTGYEFLGWTVLNEGEKNPINSSTADDRHHFVYASGTTFVMPDSSTTLYAVWSDNSATTRTDFYIRLDGKIPNEPGSFSSNLYTSGIRIDNNTTYKAWVVDNDITKSVPEGWNCVQNDVTNVLKQVPTNDQIKAVYSSYNPETHYVLWYVQKYQGTPNAGSNGTSANTWHIDGVLLERAKVSISYDPNVPAGVSTRPSVPTGYQVTAPYVGEDGVRHVVDVTVGESASVGSGDFNYANPSIPGYVFQGWNTKADGTGTQYSNDDVFGLEENTTLYAQWVKDTVSLIVKKVDDRGNPIDTATFELYDNMGIVGTSMNTANGIVRYESINVGTRYRLHEANAPEGYRILASDVYFEEVVNSDGTYSLKLYSEDGQELSENPEGIQATVSGKAVTVSVTNKALPSVILKKVDQAGNPLSGAIFKLMKDGGNVDEYSNIEPNNEATLSSLIDGSYTLVEIRPPDGYLMTSASIQFEVTEGKVSYSGNHSDVSFDSTTNTFTVKNQAGEKLPNTGGSGTQLYTFLGALLLFAAAGGMYVSRSRRAGRRSE